MATPDDPGHPREPNGPGAPSGGSPYGQLPHGQSPYGQPPSAQPPYGGPLPPPPGPGGPFGGPWGQQPSGALGTAALVLGICSIVLLLVCGVGALVALVGLVLGIMAIAKNSNRNRALAGVALSGLTLLFAVIMSVVIYNWFQTKRVGECFDPRLYPTQEDAQRCVQDRLAGSRQP